MARSKRPVEARDAVLSALEGLGLKDVARRLKIARAWPQVVGPHIADKTEVESYARGVVTVRAASAAWQNELTFLRQTILESLNAAVGPPRIRDLHIHAGAKRQTERRDPFRPARATVLHRAAARDTAAAIADDEVREGFVRLMARGLARGAPLPPPKDSPPQ